MQAYSLDCKTMNGSRDKINEVVSAIDKGKTTNLNDYSLAR